MIDNRQREMSRCGFVYRRGESLYFHTQLVSSRGTLRSYEPSFRVPVSASFNTLGHLVGGMLGGSRVVEPWPPFKSDDVYRKALFALAGTGGWLDFASNSDFCAVCDVDGDLYFCPHTRDSSGSSLGFRYKFNDRIVLTATGLSEAATGIALWRALSLCDTA